MSSEDMLIAEHCAVGAVVLDRYRIDEYLASGAMGHILRATRLDTGEPVAIKVLHQNVPLDEDNVRRFLREAKSASRLRSEHVTRIFDVGTLDTGRPLIVMELLEGTDLWHLLSRRGRAPQHFAVEIILQACDALAEAHAIRIFHRDIKPANLFLANRRDGTTQLKILDFGVSKSPESVDYSITKVHALLGTPQYMSPEQTQSGMIDARSDIWSIGAVLFELVEGYPPFYSDNFAELCAMIAFEAPQPMRAAPQLEPIVRRCLEKAPEDRYQNVAALATALAPLVAPAMAQVYVARIHRLLGRPYEEIAYAQTLPPPEPAPERPSSPLLVPPTTPRPARSTTTPPSGTSTHTSRQAAASPIRMAGAVVWIALALAVVAAAVLALALR